MTSKNIAVIGECMIELSQKGTDLSRGFGGDTLNTAVYIARQVSAPDLNVHYVTALGTDSFSEEMLTAWQQENIQTDLIQRMDNKLPGSILSRPMRAVNVPSIIGVMMRQPASG